MAVTNSDKDSVIVAKRTKSAFFCYMFSKSWLKAIHFKVGDWEISYILALRVQEDFKQSLCAFSFVTKKNSF